MNNELRFSESRFPNPSSIARKFGAETPFIRPDYLSGSEVGKFDVWKHTTQARGWG